jgi:adenine-specific DNA-methyltransferase
MARSPKGPKEVAALNHEADARRNIATAELADIQQMLEAQAPQPPAVYLRSSPLGQGEVRERDPDLDPQIIWNGARIRLTQAQIAQLSEAGQVEIGDAQLVWRGKDRQDWSDLIVTAPPLYIQEKVHPKAIIDDLTRMSKASREATTDAPDLFADFNGLSDPMARTEFYQHDQHWSNRMILGDSLQVMASLAEREALKGKVQCIYFDPPYGIKFNSNWQVSTQSRDVKDGKQTDVSREPEQVKAFRDTWKDGIHSYLTYLRDRLTVMRELLTESGSIFVQIGDENVHRVRALMDEVFGESNLAAQIVLQKVTGVNTRLLAQNSDYILWYCKNVENSKFRTPLQFREDPSSAVRYDQLRLSDGSNRPLSPNEKAGSAEFPAGSSRYQLDNLLSSEFRPDTTVDFKFEGKSFFPGKDNHWKTTVGGLERLSRARRLAATGGGTIRYVRMLADFNATVVGSTWTDISGAVQSRSDPKIYIVQTSTAAVQRCILMATDPGDLVLDPTCGSGTSAYVAEQWGRRWFTIDTSRVALALARTRLMSARYPYYYLKDSADGRRKEAEVSGKLTSDSQTYGDVRQGFVYERAPHVTLKSIANNAEIDVIWETWAAKLEPVRAELNTVSGTTWEEWEIPRDAAGLPDAAKPILAAWWEGRIGRQKDIDASIARAADVEYLYDRPYSDPGKVRVAGPFTVESLSPHRTVPADQEELSAELDVGESRRKRGPLSTPDTDFATMALEHLKTAGVHQTNRADRIAFTALVPWPGRYIGAEGRFMEGETERRAAIFIGPEFGTISRIDLTAAAREAAESRFDVLIACSFAFDALASELTRLGPLPILKARMNPDLHMAGELKNTGKGNLFTVFGEPDIEIHDQPDGTITVEVKGVDIYDPNTGEVRSSDVKGIAAWFIDTAYNEESFFVRHAYFLGANEPYKALKTALKAEIDEDAWATLNKATSRPFGRPDTGRIAVKVINHFGDEVMKVFGV